MIVSVFSMFMNMLPRLGVIDIWSVKYVAMKSLLSGVTQMDYEVL
jgi:hypothetical protein